MNQTFDDYEIVILDDGSMDNSLQLCRLLKDKRIRIYHQDNQGKTAARINRTNKAKGEYTIMVDADDALEQDCLNVVNEYIKIIMQMYLCLNITNAMKI